MSHSQQDHLQEQNLSLKSRITTKIKTAYQIVKEKLQNFIALSFTVLFFFPIWIFKIIFKALDIAQLLIKLLFKIGLKVVAGFIKIYLAVFRLLGFMRLASYVQKKLKFILNEKFTSKSSSSSTERESVQHNQQGNQTQKIVEKYVINPPDIFSKKPCKVYNASTDQIKESNSLRDRINQNIIPQREVFGNMVTHSQEVKSPKVFTDSKVHSSTGLKRHPTDPNIFSSIQQAEKNKLIKPDRYLSPQFHRQISFKKNDKKSAEHQILLSNTHLANGQKKQQEKQELQKQIGRLRRNMAEVVQKNQNQISQLQEWISEKSLTLNITKNQNLILIQDMEELQKQNIQKTIQYESLQVNLKQIQKQLMSEQFQKSELLSKIDDLQEQIKVKTIQIMSLRDKIKKNYEHVEIMSNLLSERTLQENDTDSQNLSRQISQQSNISSIQNQSQSEKIEQSDKTSQTYIKIQQIQKKIETSNNKKSKNNKKKNKKYVQKEQNGNVLTEQIKSSQKEAFDQTYENTSHKNDKILNQTNDDSSLFQ